MQSFFLFLRVILLGLAAYLCFMCGFDSNSLTGFEKVLFIIFGLYLSERAISLIPFDDE